MMGGRVMEILFWIGAALSMIGGAVACRSLQAGIFIWVLGVVFLVGYIFAT